MKLHNIRIFVVEFQPKEKFWLWLELYIVTESERGFCSSSEISSVSEMISEIFCFLMIFYCSAFFLALQFEWLTHIFYKALPIEQHIKYFASFSFSQRSCLSRVDRLKELINKKKSSTTANTSSMNVDTKDSVESSGESDEDDDIDGMFDWRAKMA